MAPMRWQLFALCTVLAIICTVHCPCPACRLAAASLCYWARVFHSSVFAKHARFAVICAHFAYTYRDTGYGATASKRLGYQRPQLHTRPPALKECSQLQSRHQIVTRTTVEVRSSAKKQIKGAKQKEFQRRRGLPARRARAGGPESHRPPPRRDAAGAGPLRFPRDESTRQRSIRSAHFRAGHGRVRRVARVTARGGAVRDEDHQFLPLRR